MSLDFIPLSNLTKASKKPLSTALKQNQYKVISEEKEALKCNLEGSQSISNSQQQKSDREAGNDLFWEICKEHQENIRRSGQLKTQIIKGVKLGEDIYSLFLKAVEAIGLMTSDTVFYSQLDGDIRAIYGVGLQKQAPLELESTRIQQALEKLEQACKRKDEPPDSLQRIKDAIRAHRQRVLQLKEMIEKINSGESLTA